MAPRLAASMMPGPPPVITVKPASASKKGRPVRPACNKGWTSAGESRRAEHRDAGPHEMQRAKAADQLPGNSHRRSNSSPRGCGPSKSTAQAADGVAIRPSRSDGCRDQAGRGGQSWGLTSRFSIGAHRDSLRWATFAASLFTALEKLPERSKPSRVRCADQMSFASRNRSAQRTYLTAFYQTARTVTR